MREFANPDYAKCTENCPNLKPDTKLISMDTSMVVNKIKKNFKIFHFLAKFFSWSAHALPSKKFLFAKKFIFVHIFILDVHIYCQNVHL